MQPEKGVPLAVWVSVYQDPTFFVCMRRLVRNYHRSRKRSKTVWVDSLDSLFVMYMKGQFFREVRNVKTKRKRKLKDGRV